VRGRKRSSRQQRGGIVNRGQNMVGCVLWEKCGRSVGESVCVGGHTSRSHSKQACQARHAQDTESDTERHGRHTERLAKRLRDNRRGKKRMAVDCPHGDDVMRPRRYTTQHNHTPYHYPPNSMIPYPTSTCPLSHPTSFLFYITYPPIHLSVDIGDTRRLATTLGWGKCHWYIEQKERKGRAVVACVAD